MPTFTESVTDGLTLSDSVAFSVNQLVTVSDAVVFSDQPTLSYFIGEALTELLTLRDTVTFKAITPITVKDAISLSETIGLAYLKAVTDGLTVADIVTVTRAVFVADALGFTDAATLNGSAFNVSIVDAIVANDALAWFWGGKFSDAVAFSDRASFLLQIPGIASDSLVVADTVTPVLQIRVIAADNLDISDEATLIGIYTQSLSDSFQFTCALLGPSGDFTTWAINTRTGAVTEYQNYGYNSFAQNGHHYLGASSSGLYQLDGPLDTTTAVVATIKSGSAQFSGSRYTAFDAIYLGCRVSDGANDWLLKLVTGDGRCYVYQFQPLNQRTTKIFVGKGLRARYFTWELITAGEQFDLDDIEFVPIGSKRRV